MARPPTLNPITVPIRGHPDEALAVLRDLAARGALWHGVKSLYINIVPQHEKCVLLDIENDFLRVYPNMRDLVIRGFDGFRRATSNDNFGDCERNISERTEFKLRNLSLASRIEVSHPARALLEQLQHTPHLAYLNLDNFTLHPVEYPDTLPRSPYVLQRYHYRNCDGASTASWTAPFTSTVGNAVPATFAMCLTDGRGTTELIYSNADLSRVRRLAIVVSDRASLLFRDYGVIVSRCTNLRHLYFCTTRNRTVDGLNHLLSNLVESLLSFTIVINLGGAACVWASIDHALGEALKHPGLRRLRSFFLSLAAYSDQEVMPSFPTLLTSCHARRIGFTCKVEQGRQR